MPCGSGMVHWGGHWWAWSLLTAGCCTGCSGAGLLPVLHVLFLTLHSALLCCG